MFGSLKKQLSYCGEPSPKQNRTLPSSNLSCRKLSDLESPNMCFLTTLRTRQYGSFPYDTKDRFANLKNEKGKHGTWKMFQLYPGDGIRICVCRERINGQDFTDFDNRRRRR